MANVKTAGAKDLREYLGEKGLSVSAFCLAHKLDRIQVMRALSGERKRFSVDFAEAIENATNGHVKWFRWRSATTSRRTRRASHQVST